MKTAFKRLSIYLLIQIIIILLIYWIAVFLTLDSTIYKWIFRPYTFRQEDIALCMRVIYLVLLVYSTVIFFAVITHKDDKP